MNNPPARSARRQVASSFLIVFLLTGVAGACGGAAGSAGGDIPTTPITPVVPVSTTAVSILNTAFNPPAISVAPGSSVSFTNDDHQAHNVTFDNTNVARTGDFVLGTKVLVMPTTVGTYAYHCTLHSGMTGSVTVQ